MVRFSTIGGRGGIDRHGGLESAVCEVPGFVEGRHVHALDASEGSQDVEPVGATSRLPGCDGRVDLADHLLAVAQHHEVEEVGERLRVVGGVATGPDQRLRCGAIGRSDGHPGEIDAVEDVRVDELGREVEGDEVELVGGPMGVDREQREPFAAHDLLEVGPGRIRALGEGIRPLVQDLVEDLQPLVGEADLVRVRVHEEPPDPLRGGRRYLGAELAADVARRLLDRGEVRLEPSPDIDHGEPRVPDTLHAARHRPRLTAGDGLSGRRGQQRAYGGRWPTTRSSPLGIATPSTSAHPLARAQSASSTGCRAPHASRRAGRTSGGRAIHATARSLAGSPAVMSPKSMTAEIRPPSTSTFSGWTSPWSHTGGSAHGSAFEARCHSSIRGVRSISASSRSSPAAKIAARSARGTPRYGLAGASGGAGRCTAARKPPSWRAASPQSSGRASSSSVPASHGHTDHAHG